MATTNPAARAAASNPPDPSADDGRPQKGMTIGGVCKGLAQEFPDISIS